MSEVFEGVLSVAPADALGRVASSFAPTLLVESEELGDGVSVVYRRGPRDEAQFSPEVDKLAAELSGAFDRSLVVRYDSRLGQRSSVLYERRQPVKSFGEADEVFVLLDEEGQPLTKGERFRADELDSEQEYETVRNAIQLGLEAFGRGHWETLFDLMTR